MWNKHDKLCEDNWVTKIDTTLATRVSPGDTIAYGDRQCVVLDVADIGGGLYSVRLGHDFIYDEESK